MRPSRAARRTCCWSDVESAVSAPACAPPAADALRVGVDEIDARGCVVTPGIIDPHEHLIGGSGEEGFASRSPELTFSVIVQAGITSVVGCLGVDVDTRTMAALVAKAKGLNAEGLSARLLSGGYRVPPATLTGSVRTDIMFVEEVIGAGAHRSILEAVARQSVQASSSSRPSPPNIPASSSPNTSACSRSWASNTSHSSMRGAARTCSISPVRALGYTDAAEDSGDTASVHACSCMC